MRILHIDETFNPLYGYHTAPLAQSEAKAGNQVYILTGSWEMLYPVYRQFGDSVTDSDNVDAAYEYKFGVKIIRVGILRYISNRAVYSHDIFKYIKDINPDVIYVHLVESLIAVQLLLHKKNYSMIFDSHMLTMGSKNKFAKIYNLLYKTVITPIICRNKYCVVRTQDDDYVNRVLRIPATLAPHISFGTDTDLFRPLPEARRTFLQKHNLPENSFIIVCTGKLNEDKGAMLLAQAAREKFAAIEQNVVFLIVGNTVGKYGELVEAELGRSENKIIRYPLQKYIDLPMFYQCADLCVFPKQCSLSFYDAQACGLPVISEDNNINVDRCSHGNGWTFSIGSVQDFRNKMEIAMNMNAKDFCNYRRNAVAFIMSNYDYRCISRQYTKLYNEAILNYRNTQKR